MKRQLKEEATVGLVRLRNPLWMWQEASATTTVATIHTIKGAKEKKKSGDDSNIDMTFIYCHLLLKLKPGSETSKW